MYVKPMPNQSSNNLTLEIMGEKHGLRLKKIWGFVTTLLPWATLTLITLFLKLLKCAK